MSDQWVQTFYRDLEDRLFTLEILATGEHEAPEWKRLLADLLAPGPCRQPAERPWRALYGPLDPPVRCGTRVFPSWTDAAVGLINEAAALLFFTLYPASPAVMDESAIELAEERLRKLLADCRPFGELRVWIGKEQAALTTAAEPTQTVAVQSPTKPVKATPTEVDAPSDGNKYRRLDSLSPVHRRAYCAFIYAEARNERRLQDHEAWSYLRESGIDPKDAQGDLADYTLPAFATFTRYLRAARKALGESKYTPRSGRVTGGSIVSAQDIEPSLDD